MAERLDFVLRLVDKMSAPAKRAARSLKGIDKQIASLSASGKGLISLSANLSLAAGAASRMARASAGVLLAPIKEAATFEQTM